VAATFDDVESLASGCRFADCRHADEPECAVQAAVATGELTPERLDAWRSLLRETEAAARRAEPHVQRAHERRFSRVAKEAQRRKGRHRDP
jgi:ribosome biogenesis GTPase / thiamine phosphate phosphatase